jgi:hypothetical protein
MARDLAVDDTLTDDQPTADDAPMDAFGNEFEDAAASALDDSQDDVADPGDDVVEGDLEPLEDTDTPETPPIGVDRGDGRDATGKFATKAEQDAADAKAQAETTAPTAAPAAPVVEQAAPVFEPLVVRADKTLHPIDEAQVTRANGYHVITIKDEDAPRFMQRMSKGIVGEKIWRDLQTGIKELEQERAAPQAKTDSQIEAEIILATIKDRLGELLEPHEVRNLELEIKLAQRDYKDTYAQERTQFFAAQAEKEQQAQAPEIEQRAQLEGIANALIDLRETQDDLRGLSDAQVEQAFNELKTIARAAYWKETDGKWYMDQRLMYDRLKAVQAGTASSSAPPSNGQTATASRSPKPDAADRFNKAGNTAARPATPGTTSVKAGRGKTDPAQRPSRSPTPTTTNRPAKTAAMQAEDRARAQQKKFMASDGLDFEDDDDS